MNNRAIVTGSCGLVGYTTCKRLLSEGWQIFGIDNDSRAEYFGSGASTLPLRSLLSKYGEYTHYTRDVSDPNVSEILRSGADLIVHCAAQPSHDWATHNVLRDYSVNALGTLHLLEAWRYHCPRAVFIHVSTSKVYGDGPNELPLIEYDTRLDLSPEHELWQGIPESFPVDQRLHSFFGVSKLSADILAQEYGRHLGLPVGVFRPGCVTGGHHRGAELHGFLAYLMRCTYLGSNYRVYGYKGKQVRCNVHAEDLVDAFLRFATNPKPGAVYNIGGRGLDCSLLEAVEECQRLCGRSTRLEMIDQPRTGDHRWWVSNTKAIERDYDWKPRRWLPEILEELYQSQKETPAA